MVKRECDPSGIERPAQVAGVTVVGINLGEGTDVGIIRRALRKDRIRQDKTSKCLGSIHGKTKPEEKGVSYEVLAVLAGGQGRSDIYSRDG